MTETAQVDGVFLASWISSDRSDQNRDKWRGVLPICRQRAWESTVCFTQRSFRHCFTFDQGILTSAFLLHDVSSMATATQGRCWWLQWVIWAEVTSSCSDISSWFDRVVQSLLEGHIFTPPMQEQGKRHAAEKMWMKRNSAGPFICCTALGEASCLIHPKYFKMHNPTHFTFPQGSVWEKAIKKQICGWISSFYQSCTYILNKS